MKPLGDPRQHYLLASGMGRATGTDLNGAFANGALTSEDWATLLHRCRGCQWADGCAHWLPEHLDQGVEAPDGCVNRETFRRLRDI